MAATENLVPEHIEGVAADLLGLAADAEARFGRLSATQLNWKPGPGRWSVAQCFDHLVATQVHYLPALRRLAKGEATPTAWERLSPLSGFFGRLLVRAVDPDNHRKVRTAARSEPSSSDLDEGVIVRFAEHQRELVEHVRALLPGLDPKRVVVSSPLMPVVTYSLDDCLTIFVLHGRRHFQQAARVVEAEGFPA